LSDDRSQYGDEAAEIYDWMYAGDEVSDAQISGLLDLARGGSIVEIGVGTGRIAIPLAEGGAAVTGIDVSRLMLDKARQKIRQLPVRLVHQDVTVEPIVGQFALCLVSINTFFMLGDHAAQRMSMCHMADCLPTGGILALETFNAPRELHPRDRQSVRVCRISHGVAWLELNIYNQENRTFDIADIVFHTNASQLYTTRLSYWYLDELDQLALDNRMKLIHRWRSWAQDAFDDTARDAVSIYQKVA
jgi:SAM-dependent methyltransferase